MCFSACLDFRYGLYDESHGSHDAPPVQLQTPVAKPHRTIVPCGARPLQDCYRALAELRHVSLHLPLAYQFFRPYA